MSQKVVYWRAGFSAVPAVFLVFLLLTQFGLFGEIFQTILLRGYLADAGTKMSELRLLETV